MEIKIAKPDEMAEVFGLRTEVFVEEQGVSPDIELDSEDERATHIIARDDGAAVGCARILFDEKNAHIGRLAVKKSRRGEGIGAAVCRFIMELCRDMGKRTVWLDAQLHAVPFYRKLGFLPEGEIFLEAGIEHIRMTAAL